MSELIGPSKRSIRNYVKNQEKSKAKEKVVEEDTELDDEQSTLSEEDLMRFLYLENLPTNIVIRNTYPDESPKQCLEDYVVLYEYPFKIGLSLAFPTIVIDLLQVFGISIRQLIPQDGEFKCSGQGVDQMG